MAYKGLRKTVPHARYGSILDVLQEMGWTLDEYLAQPYDLIDELTIRLHKQALGAKTHGGSSARTGHEAQRRGVR
jgi:hypothetical protein